MKNNFDPKRPIYLVFWRDAHLMVGWGPYDFPNELSLSMTMGFLRRRTKTTIEIAQSATAEGDFDAVFVIPRNAITKIVQLSGKRRVKRAKSKNR